MIRSVLILSNDSPATIGGVQMVCRLLIEYWQQSDVPVEMSFTGSRPLKSQYDIVHCVGFSSTFVFKQLRSLDYQKLFITPAWHPFSRHRRPFLAKLYFETVSKYYFRRATKIHTFSKKEHDFFLSHGCENCVIFPLPCKSLGTLNERLERDIDVLFVGRADRLKGFDVFQECAARNPNLSFHCVLPSRPEQKVFPSNVAVSLKVEEEELFQLYQRTKLYLQPSAWESFGLAIVEAYSQGSKILCSRNVMITDWINGSNIHSLPYGADVETWSAKINEIIAQASENMVTNDKRSLSQFSFDEFLANLTELYSNEDI